jgi:hypothetical protein
LTYSHYAIFDGNYLQKPNLCALRSCGRIIREHFGEAIAHRRARNPGGQDSSAHRREGGGQACHLAIIKNEE